MIYFYAYMLFIACLLTTTKRAATVTTTVTAAKAPITRTVYKTGSQQPAVTKTITVTESTAGPSLSAPEVTIVVTEALTQTEGAVITVTEKQTDTSITTTTQTETDTVTAVTTTIATTTRHPCDDLDYILVTDESWSNRDVVSGFVADSWAARDCCVNCYMNSDCVFARFGNSLCEGFFTKRDVTNTCQSDQCPRGLSGVNVFSGDGLAYIVGPCMGGRTK